MFLLLLKLTFDNEMQHDTLDWTAFLLWEMYAAFVIMNFNSMQKSSFAVQNFGKRTLNGVQILNRIEICIMCMNCRFPKLHIRPYK